VAKVKISAAPSIRRLPSYLHIIRRLQGEGNAFISGTVIAQELNLEPIQVRKDLAITGIIGKPKKGYPVQALVGAIEHFLGWDSPLDAVLVGAGNLGAALLGYGEFRHHGLRVTAAFDKNPQKIGSSVHGVPVFDAINMEERIRGMEITAAILTVPSVQAQETAEILVRAGIRGIWNFTNVKLKVPERVVVQKEDLSSGYAMFCVMLQAKKPEKDGEHGTGLD
jgi:redox-sensing transcriptional repressor